MFKSSVFSWTHFWGGCKKLSTSHWWSKWPTTRNFCGRHWSTTIPHGCGCCVKAYVVDMKMLLTMEVAHWAGCCMKFYDFNLDFGTSFFMRFVWEFLPSARESTIQKKATIWSLAFSIVDLLTVEHPKYWRHLLTSQSKPRGFKSAKYHWQIPSWLLHYHFIPSQNHSESVKAKACLPALHDWECKGYHCMWFRQEENFHFLWLRLCPFYFN